MLAINKDTERNTSTIYRHSEMCIINPAHLSSLKRRPIKILHFSGGRQAASKGTVLNTRLSCKKKKKLLLIKNQGGLL